MPTDHRSEPPSPTEPELAGTLEKRLTKGGATRWFVRLRLPDGTRPRHFLGEGLSEARARDKATAITQKVRQLGLRPPARRRRRPTIGPEPSTSLAAPNGASYANVQELGEAWTTGAMLERHGPVNRLRPKASADTDMWRLEKYVYPLIGHLAVPAVTTADVEQVMRKLPAEMEPETRLRVYSMLHRLFDLAIMPARLRKEGDNPVSRYLRPAVGAPSG